MSDTATPIRIAVVGTSMITGLFLEAASYVADVRVTTAFSRDAARAAAYAQEHGLPRSTDDFAGLLDSDDIDAVYIASPNGLHLEQALAVVRAGKHALVEKPATPTAADFQTLLDEAAVHGVVVLEAMRSAYDPGWAAIRDRMPKLGVIRQVSFSYCQRSSRYDKVLAGERVNIFDPALAGGALWDLGVYTIHPLVRLFGEPERIVAATVPVPGGAVGTGTALALYPGFLATLRFSKITGSDLPSEIQGEKGTLTFDEVPRPRSIRMRLLDGTIEDIAIEGAENNMQYEIERFADLVHGRADAAADHADTLAMLHCVDAIREVAIEV